MECYIISTHFFIIPLLSAVWIMLQGYIPNPVAAVSGGGTPVDLGRNFTDGRRIFGDGKTGGASSSASSQDRDRHYPDVGSGAYGLFFLPHLTLLTVCLLATGALLGDIVKSFFKRRFGRERGAKWPVADQYDLVTGAFFLLLVFDSGWLFGEVTLPAVFFILILTPILHRAVNIIGFVIKVKEVPW